MRVRVRVCVKIVVRKMGYVRIVFEKPSTGTELPAEHVPVFCNSMIS